MTLTPQLWQNLALAISLGLVVALILWLFRRRTAIRRMRVFAVLTTLLAAGYLTLTGLGQPTDALAVRITTALLILFAANTLLQGFNWLVWDYTLGRRRGWVIPRLIVDVFSVLVLLIVALIDLNQVFGIDLSGLLVTSTVVSAVIGLALQDTLGNVISGLALQLEHPFAVGDWVLVSGQEGQVVQMSWRTVTLRTTDLHNIFIPNGNIAKELVINYSRPAPLQRMHASVHIAYGHPPGVVKTVLEQAAADAEGVAATPRPQAVIKSFDDFAIHYVILYWITDYSRVLPIRDNVLTGVWYALQRAHIALPYPVRDVTVKMLGDDHDARQAADRRGRVAAALRRLAIFGPLSPAQIEQVAQTAQHQRYTKGELLVREGDPGDSLFVITTGRVRIEKRLDDGATLTLDHLEAEDFFGEMSLLTGAPRTASVIAEAEVEVLLVDKAGLASVILSDTRIVEALSTALEARVRHTGARVAAATGSLAERKSEPAQVDFVTRIRRFFGLGAA